MRCVGGDDVFQGERAERAEELRNACGARFGRATHRARGERRRPIRVPGLQATATVGAIGGHRRFCDAARAVAGDCGGVQRQARGRTAPRLCSPCSPASAPTGPPTRTTTRTARRASCARCAKKFESIGRRGRSVMAARKCRWCGVGAQLIHGKGPGPTAQRRCAQRAHHDTVRPHGGTLRDADGNRVPVLRSLALGGHRRFCGQLADFDRDHLALVDSNSPTPTEAAEVALPQRRRAGCRPSAKRRRCAYDFTRYSSDHCPPRRSPS